MTMEMQEFDGMLDDVLRGMVSAPVPDGLVERVSGRMRVHREIAPVAVLAPVFGVADEAGLLRSLWDGVREMLRPKPPPLVLASRPVPVVDRMADDRGYRGRVWALAMHGVAILLIGAIVRAQVGVREVTPPALVVALAAPPKLPVKASAMGGGGGQHELAPATKGAPPKFAEMPIVPPKAPPMEEAKIHVDPAVDVQQDVKMRSDLPQIGVANSPVVGMSMGNGRGSGIGSGNGNGYGPGSGGGMGDGVKQVGGGVSEPVPIYQVDPEFTEEARKARAEGYVTVDLLVDAQGRPSHVHAVQGIGMGLNEKAEEAVKQYRFKPALENGKPVTVEMNVLVHFQIY
jgi:periplasmic protein TonB